MLYYATQTFHMPHQPIALHLLVSPKAKLDYHKRSKIEFSNLITMIRAKRKVDSPIEVYPLGNGKFYIADGVHRAKAAELAGIQFIDAIIFTDSKPFGLMVPLCDVIV